jgi:hypothetical protein
MDAVSLYFAFRIIRYRYFNFLKMILWLHNEWQRTMIPNLGKGLR